MTQPKRDIEKLKSVKYTCDQCPYIPRDLTDYLSHLDNAHPDGGKATAW